MLSVIVDGCPLQEPQCKVCRQTPVIRSSKHLFLDLPKVYFSYCHCNCLGCPFYGLNVFFFRHRELRKVKKKKKCKVEFKVRQLVGGSYPCGNCITTTLWFRVKTFSSAFSFALFLSCSWRLSWSSGWTSQPAQETGQQMPNRSLAPGWEMDSNLAASPGTWSGERQYLILTLKRRSAIARSKKSIFHIKTLLVYTLLYSREKMHTHTHTTLFFLFYWNIIKPHCYAKLPCCEDNECKHLISKVSFLIKH